MSFKSHHTLMTFWCSSASSTYFCALGTMNELSSGFRVLKYFAGLPAHNWFAGTVLPAVTTAPAATIAPFSTWKTQSQDLERATK